MNPKPPSYFEKLEQRCERADSQLCIGLDPDPRRIPALFGNGPEAVFRFLVDIVEATADFAAAFKVNPAYYEAIGAEGWHVMAQALERIPDDVPVILEANRGETGTAAQAAARAWFDRLDVDAVTLNPLLGRESVEPFLKYESRGVYLLCLTSGAGADDFLLENDLYLRIAARAREWNAAGNIGLVLGARRREEWDKAMRASEGLPVLAPGLDAQGGLLDDLIGTANERPRSHSIVNVSRSILFASGGGDYGHAARKTARYYRDMLNKSRNRAAAE